MNPKPPDCKHLIIPTGNGLGRCMSTCKAEGWHLTPEAGGACPGCGGYGECTVPCDGQARQPWALARRALNRLRSSEFFNVHGRAGSLHLVALDLMRITGDVWTVNVPGEYGGVWVEYEDGVAKRAWWSIVIQKEQSDALLQLVGLRAGWNMQMALAQGVIQTDVEPVR